MMLPWGNVGKWRWNAVKGRTTCTLRGRSHHHEVICEVERYKDWTDRMRGSKFSFMKWEDELRSTISLSWVDQPQSFRLRRERTGPGGQRGRIKAKEAAGGEKLTSWLDAFLRRVLQNDVQMMWWCVCNWDTVCSYVGTPLEGDDGSGEDLSIGSQLQQHQRNP